VLRARKVYRVGRGLDVEIGGTPVQHIDEVRGATGSVALLSDDFVGQQLSPLVQVGDRVRLAEPLAVDLDRPRIHHTSPGAGVVREVLLGERRRLVSIVVDLDGDDEVRFDATPTSALASLDPEDVKERLVASGLWTALRARPFDRVPDPATSPRSVFVTATDTTPLSADAEVVLARDPEPFVDGLRVVAHLTRGPVFVCSRRGAALPIGEVDRVNLVEFAGPHPAGLVGTHVHRLDPVGPGRTVWHLGYQDVQAIGTLFTTGRVATERIVSLGGPMVARPRLIRTRLGACTDDLVCGELRSGDCRVISGSPLSGRQASGWGRFLGRYHAQVCVLPEGAPAERRRPFGRRPPSTTTALHGRPTVFFPSGVHERVIPLDLQATPLLRALLVGDTAKAQALGCLELAEEDLALATYVCPGKLEYGEHLRAALERIAREG